MSASKWLKAPAVNNAIYQMAMVGDRVYFVGLFSAVGATSVGAVAGFNYSNQAIDVMQGTVFLRVSNDTGGVTTIALQQIVYIEQQNALYVVDIAGFAYAYAFPSQLWFLLNSLSTISQITVTASAPPVPIPPTPSTSH
jgi:hypothetical protein